jgi:hypothetical protein
VCKRGIRGSAGRGWEFQVTFNSSDLYAPTLKASEARLLTAIAAEHGCPLLKTDTRQAFLYGEMGEDKEVYIRPPDWWPEPIPEGHDLLLLKSMYGPVVRHETGRPTMAYLHLGLDGAEWIPGGK